MTSDESDSHLISSLLHKKNKKWMPNTKPTTICTSRPVSKLKNIPKQAMLPSITSRASQDWDWSRSCRSGETKVYHAEKKTSWTVRKAKPYSRFTRTRPSSFKQIKSINPTRLFLLWIIWVFMINTFTITLEKSNSINNTPLSRLKSA